MTERNRYRPFTGDAQRRIRLESPPVPLVVAQVRWPELTELQGGIDEAAGRLAQRLDSYPFHDRGQEVSVQITQEGVTTQPGEVVHQWQSENREWHIAFTRRSFAVFCIRYSGFDEFADRLRVGLEALASTVGVPTLERVGLRYVNRIVDEETIKSLPEMVESAILGLSLLRASSAEVSQLTSLSQAIYAVGQDRLQVRSGFLPAGETVDPAIPPVGNTSWVLDLDAMRDAPGPLFTESVLDVVGRLADINYDFFKLIAKNKYVERMENT